MCWLSVTVCFCCIEHCCLVFRHEDAWNQVLVGRKRWTLYEKLPPEADHNPCEPHIAWLKNVYPEVAGRSDLAPLECMQNEGKRVEGGGRAHST